jgi:hypothetical protein
MAELGDTRETKADARDLSLSWFVDEDKRVANRKEFYGEAPPPTSQRPRECAPQCPSLGLPLLTRCPTRYCCRQSSLSQPASPRPRARPPPHSSHRWQIRRQGAPDPSSAAAADGCAPVYTAQASMRESRRAHKSAAPSVSLPLSRPGSAACRGRGSSQAEAPRAHDHRAPEKSARPLSPGPRRALRQTHSKAPREARAWRRICPSLSSRCAT